MAITYLIYVPDNIATYLHMNTAVESHIDHEMAMS